MLREMIANGCIGIAGRTHPPFRCNRVRIPGDITLNMQMDGVACRQCASEVRGGRCTCDAMAPLNDREFLHFCRFIREAAGIHMTSAKKALVSGRLGRRVRHHGLRSFGDYFELVMSREGENERQTMVDLLTTNETYFFREEKHFDLLRERILPAYKGSSLSLWSAACSTGEEAYSLAMTLADICGSAAFSILGTDISKRVVAQAERAVYPTEKARRIPGDYLRRFCLRGIGRQEGNFTIDKRLRQRVAFRLFNLNGEWRDIGPFDIIFLRNVMIYFDTDTKQRLVQRMAECLVPGGYLFVGHSESLNGMSHGFRTVTPSVYQRL